LSSSNSNGNLDACQNPTPRPKSTKFTIFIYNKLVTFLSSNFFELPLHVFLALLRKIHSTPTSKFEISNLQSEMTATNQNPTNSLQILLREPRYTSHERLPLSLRICASLKIKSHKNDPFLAISCAFLRISYQFLAIFTHFCFAHFNTCAFACAKTPLTTQKQRFTLGPTQKIPQFFKNPDNSSS